MKADGLKTRVVLRTVHQLEERDNGYDGAPRGKVLIDICGKLEISPPEAEELLDEQIAKGRIAIPEKNRLRRV